MPVDVTFFLEDSEGQQRKLSFLDLDEDSASFATEFYWACGPKDLGEMLENVEDDEIFNKVSFDPGIDAEEARQIISGLIRCFFRQQPKSDEWEIIKVTRT